MGGDVNAYLSDITIASQSNDIVMTGKFSGILNLGGNTLDAIGSSTDMYVAKLSDSGQHIWSRTIGGNEADIPAGLDVSADGRVAYSGYFNSSLSVDGTQHTSAGSFDTLFGLLQ